MTYLNMEQVKRANEAAGQCWFSPATLRFFRCRVSSVLHGGRYFVTSERGPSYGAGRFYTIREATTDGSISTVGEFQEFDTHNAAMRRAAYLAGVS